MDRGAGGAENQQMTPAGPFVARRTTSFAWLLWSVTLALAAAPIVRYSPGESFDLIRTTGVSIGTIAVATIGALVATRATVTRPGWLLLGFGLWWSVGLATYWLVETLLGSGAVTLVTAQQLVVLADVAFIVSMGGLFGVFLVVPDGRLSPLGVLVAWILAPFLLFWIVFAFVMGGAVTDPLAYVTRPTLTSSAGVQLGDGLRVLNDVMTWAGLGVVVVFGWALVDRYRRSSGEERQQLKWLFFGSMSVTGWLLLWIPQPESAILRAVQASLPGLALFSLAAGAGLALFRYRLWDVDVVIRRSCTRRCGW